MNFENKLISGVFIKRYKRFFVDVQIENKVITAHCPNTGSMKGLLKEGNKVWLSKSNNPDRKLKYTLQIIEDKKSKVGVNTHLTNKIVLDALKNNLIKEFDKDIDLRMTKQRKKGFFKESYRESFDQLKLLRKELNDYGDCINQRIKINNEIWKCFF